MSEIASNSRSRLTAPSMPSTTPSPMPPSEGRSGPAERRTPVPHRPQRSPNRKPRNLAARMGRWSAAHWKTATFGWLAFVVVAFALGGMVGTKSIDPTRRSGRVGPDAEDPRRGLQAAGRRERPDPEPLAPRGDPAFTAAIATLSRASRGSAACATSAGCGRMDGHTALVDFQIRGDSAKAVDKVAPVLKTSPRRSGPTRVLHRRVRC